MSEAEMDVQPEQPMSSEDKFFGVKTQIGKKSSESVEEQGEFELEAVSYTHSPSPRDRQKSRMPSSA